MGRIVRNSECRLGELVSGLAVWLYSLFVFPLLKAQVPEPAPEIERPVPILTGNAGFFTNVNGGETELVPSITPVLLVPLGDRWLVESRAEFKGEFERAEGGGAYGGKVEQEIDYLQLDYIANRYLTVTAGRFLTPFGIYNERLYLIHEVLSTARAKSKSHVSARDRGLTVVRATRGRTCSTFGVSRHRDGPQEFLKDYAGTLLGIATRGSSRWHWPAIAGSCAACHAHARRKVYEAREYHPQEASQLLAWYRQLYNIEDQAAGKSRRKCWRCGSERSVPIMNHHARVAGG